MNRDPFYKDILKGLEGPLDPDLFEQCAADLLRDLYPTLVPIRGGQDMGMDGAIADGEGESFPFVTTTSSECLRNLKKSLDSYIANGGKRRDVVFATSQELSARKRKNLEDAARVRGFTLSQIHPRAAIANRLYRSPVWCMELLGLSGTPPPFSRIPLSSSCCGKES